MKAITTLTWVMAATLLVFATSAGIAWGSWEALLAAVLVLEIINTIRGMDSDRKANKVYRLFFRNGEVRTEWKGIIGQIASVRAGMDAVAQFRGAESYTGEGQVDD